MTGYRSIATFTGSLPFNGGFCKWYYIPREDIASWPAIDPQSQYLATEPVLKEGKTWYGPVQVPNDQLGFEEPMSRSAAGIYYKQKVYGTYPGDDAVSRINLENMPYYEFVIAGKQRAGGLFLVLGNDKQGMVFDADFSNGPGIKQAAATKFAFTLDSLNKAMVLPTTFQGENVTPPIQTNSNVEIIYFSNTSSVPISWTQDRLNKFGVFPTIQVWFTDAESNGRPRLVSVPISADMPPPNMSQLIVDNTGAATGFVVLGS